MPRPIHVSIMQLLRQFQRVQVPVTAVVIELEGEAFDMALSHLQNLPGSSNDQGQPDNPNKPEQPGNPDKPRKSGNPNRPTDVTEDSFKMGDVEVRRV